MPLFFVNQYYWVKPNQQYECRTFVVVAKTASSAERLVQREKPLDPDAYADIFVKAQDRDGTDPGEPFQVGWTPIDNSEYYYAKRWWV